MSVAPLNLEVEITADSQLILRWQRAFAVADKSQYLTDIRAKRQLEAALPSAIWVGTKDGYQVQCTTEVASWLKASYPSAKYEDEADIACRTLLALEDQASRRATMVKDFLEHGKDFLKNSNIAATFNKEGKITKMGDYKFKRPALLHQALGFELSRHAPFFAYLEEMGLGKTKQFLDTISYLAQKNFKDNGAKRSYKPLRVCIVLPRGILLNWAREAAMDITVPYCIGMMTYLSSRHFPELNTLNVIPTRGGCDSYRNTKVVLDTLKTPDVQLQIVITNYEAMKQNLDILKKVKFDIAFLDEAHKIKNNNSKRTKFCLELAETVKKRFIATGTPLSQGNMDLYSQFEFLAPKQALLGYTSHYSFAHAYTESKGKYKMKNVNSGKLLTLASKWSLILRKDQCIDLPEKTYHTRTIEMTETQKEIYDQVCEEVLFNLESLGAEISVPNVLVEYLRLAQVTSGYIKTTEGKEVIIDGAQVKIDEAIEVMEEDGWQKTVIWSRFVHEVKDMACALEAKGIKYVLYYGEVKDGDRQEAIDSFCSDEEIKVFIGIAQAGGVGINLTQSANVIYLSNTFSLLERLQSEDRIHRIGQKKACTYIDIVCEGTIDELVAERLAMKREHSDFFNDPTELVKSLREFLLHRAS